ncbi:MAG: hypothetical protein IT500_12785 [Rubrivivax sp.]|jgi:hypothetical protein|nr:hypothetical protein [Rubrivivax sp.]
MTRFLLGDAPNHDRKAPALRDISECEYYDLVAAPLSGFPRGAPAPGCSVVAANPWNRRTWNRRSLRENLRANTGTR